MTSKQNKSKPRPPAPPKLADPMVAIGIIAERIGELTGHIASITEMLGNAQDCGADTANVTEGCAILLAGYCEQLKRISDDLAAITAEKGGRHE